MSVSGNTKKIKKIKLFRQYMKKKKKETLTFAKIEIKKLFINEQMNKRKQK